MKKIILPALLACTVPLNAQADTILGVFVGGYAWQTGISGDGELATLGSATIDDVYDDETSTVVYAALEHPIPVVPNIRIAQNAVEFEDNTSTFDLTSSDITLYYEVLDNIVSLDIGLAARMYSGEYEDTALPLPFPSPYQSDIDNTQALAYAMVRGDLPFTGLALGGQLYAGTDSTSDLNLFVEYETPIGLGFTLGYRALATEVETEDKAITADVDVDGGYLAVFFHL
jgi:outer membrane protein